MVDLLPLSTYELTDQVYMEIAAKNEVVVVATERAKNVNILEGARVGIMGKPCAEFVAGMWGTWLSGAVAVPLALNHPEAELLHVLSDAVHRTLYVSPFKHHIIMHMLFHSFIYYLFFVLVFVDKFES